jgi:hypothetical protein
LENLDENYEYIPAINLADEAARQHLSGVAIKAMRRLAKLWDVTNGEMSILLGLSSKHDWVTIQSKEWHCLLSEDTLNRVSVLLGIFKALNNLYSLSPLAETWVNRPNMNILFGGRLPIECMIEGGLPMLIKVRDMLQYSAYN